MLDGRICYTSGRVKGDVCMRIHQAVNGGEESGGRKGVGDVCGVAVAERRG
jgi:hypothetical protein